MAYIRIGGAALNQTPIDWENNIDNIRNAIDEARHSDIQILCLPELCVTGYGCEDLFLSQWVPEKALELLLSLRDYCHDIAVAIGLPIRIDDKLYNCSAFIENRKIKGIAAKQFLARDGVHYEPRWFTSWKAGKIIQWTIDGETVPFGEIIIESHGARIGFEICEDAWVADPARPAHRLSTRGIDLIMNPSASHFSFGKSAFRYKLISSSSKTFHCAYIYANLLGNEAGRIIYDGEVLIYNEGKMLQRNHRFSFKNTNLVYADIDFEKNIALENELARDEREKEYEFWEATSLGLFDYLRKSRSSGFVLSLSGGADSSACAVMVSEMIKRGVKELGTRTFRQKLNLSHGDETDTIQSLTSQLLTTVYQATKNSGQVTLNAARELSRSIGATFHHWAIDTSVDAYTHTIEKALQRALSWHTDDIALQNIQARARSPIIWMLANIKNALLITTSNRSEGDVGYATMDGDTSGSIAPIAGVDKPFIREWLIWAEKNLDQPGLSHVNILPPTAELRPEAHAQTDEKDLMPYHILLQIELQAIRDRKSPLEAYEILKEKNLEDPATLKRHIIKFYKMWSRNQWKRERVAPSFHLDDFNIDPKSWCRFPILSGSFNQELERLERLPE